MRAVRVRITDTLHDRDMSFVVKGFQTGQSWIERDMIVDLEDLIGGQSKSRACNMVSIVGVRNYRVESIVSAGHLQNDENGSVFAGDDLSRGVGGQRIEYKESFLKKYRQRPAGGRAEH